MRNERKCSCCKKESRGLFISKSGYLIADQRKVRSPITDLLCTCTWRIIHKGLYQSTCSLTTASMASPLVSRGPQCLSCIRRMTLSSSAIQQNRGKKQLAKDKNTTVKVQLLQNVPGYGRRGMPNSSPLRFSPMRMAHADLFT